MSSVPDRQIILERHSTEYMPDQFRDSLISFRACAAATSSRLPEYMELLECEPIQQTLVENRYNKTRATAPAHVNS